MPALAVAIFSALVVGSISSTTFEHFVENNDVHAFVFQAKIFAGGHLSVPSPPERGLFSPWMVVNDGTMYSKYPPVHSMWLALGILLFGSYKFMLSIGAGLAVVLTFLCAREFCAYSVSLAATLLLAVCPLFLLDASTLLSHGTELLFLSLFLFTLFRAERRESVLFAALAGISLALAFNTRYYQAALFGAIPSLYLFLRILRLPGAGGSRVGWNRPAAVRFLAYAGGFSAAMAVLFLGYNEAVTGDAFTLPRMVWRGGAADRPLVSFGGIFSHLPHTLEIMRIFGEWVFPVVIHPLPFLILCLILLRDRWSWLLVGVIVTVFFGMGFYRHSFYALLQIGPRYEMPLVMPFALLGARFMDRFLDAAFLRRKAPKRLTLAALALFMLFYATNVDKLGAKRRQNERTNSWRARVHRTVFENAAAPALVFLQADWIGHPHGHFVNEPTFDGDYVFALHKGLVRDLAFARDYYPDRSAYLLEGDSRLRSLNTAPPEPRWLIAGPFEELTESLMSELLGGTPDREVEISGSTWRESSFDLGCVDLSAAIGNQSECYGASHLYVRAKESLQAKLLFGADDGAVICLNGWKVFEDLDMDPLVPDEVEVPVSLQEGWNRLLVVVRQDFGPWGFCLKIVGADGRPLPEVDTWLRPPLAGAFDGKEPLWVPTGEADRGGGS